MSKNHLGILNIHVWSLIHSVVFAVCKQREYYYIMKLIHARLCLLLPMFTDTYTRKRYMYIRFHVEFKGLRTSISYFWEVGLLGSTHTHTHTHTYIYIYIYIYRERERERVTLEQASQDTISTWVWRNQPRCEQDYIVRCLVMPVMNVLYRKLSGYYLPVWSL